MRPFPALVLATLLVACGDDPVLTPSEPTSIARVGTEVGTPGWLLSEGLSVVVRDHRGEPLEGETVEWSTAENQAWLGATSSVTDADGTATVAFAPGWRVGAQKVRATIGALHQDVTVEVSTLDLAQVAFNSNGGCAIDAEGAVWCWQRVGIRERYDDPIAIPSGAIPVAVDAEHRYNEIIAVGPIGAGEPRHCGITTAGALRCWHFSGDTDPGPIATTVATPAPLHGLAATAPGYTSTGTLCGIDDEGQAWCQGRNNGGELGDGTTTSRDGFGAVAGAQRFQQLAGGGTAFCGVDLDNLVWCWGTPRATNGATTSLVPVRKAGDVAMGAIGFSFLTPCGLPLGEQRLVCWWSGHMEGVANAGGEPVTVPSPLPIVELVGTDDLGVFRFAGGSIGFAGDMAHDFGVNRFVYSPSELAAEPNQLPPTPGGFTGLISRGSSWWCATHQDGATLCALRTRAVVGVPHPQ
jgi:hypothetical protein